MRKNIFYILLLSLTLLTSCSKQPKCDSDEAIQLAKDLIKQELASSENSNAFSFLGVADKSALENFVNDNIEVINIRTTSKDEELKKCDCASQISFKFSDELMTKLNEASKNGFVGLMIGNPLEKQIEYTFNLQLIEKEDELYIEGFVPTDDLNGIFTLYSMIAPSIEKEKEIKSQNSEKMETKTVKRDDTDISENSGEIVVQKSYIYKNPDYSSKSKMYLIKGDVFDIGENQNGFYEIYYKGVHNDKNIEGFIPEEDMKLLYLDKFGNKTYIE